MNSSKIEVGDVFTHIATGATEYTAVEVSGGRILDNIGDWSTASCCRLVRKADPYHGITLPEPPAGYRLAKWGEGVPIASLWWDCSLSLWTHEWVRTEWPRDNPQSAIFAIPLDQPSPESVEKLVATMQDRGYTVEKVEPPLKSWQFREVPWVAQEPKTLADVPDGVDAICSTGKSHSLLRVMRRRGDTAYYRYADDTSTPSTFSPIEVRVVRFLDTPPQKPLSLDDVPDGRVIRCQDRWHWKVGATWWRLSDSGGVWPNMAPRFGSEFTVTNYIAEFREPA